MLIILSSVMTSLREAAETLTGSRKLLEETCSSVACSVRDNEIRLLLRATGLKTQSALEEMCCCQK